MALGVKGSIINSQFINSIIPNPESSMRYMNMAYSNSDNAYNKKKKSYGGKKLFKTFFLI